nr:BV-like protein [Cotesia vestalis bracovirus]
MASYSDKRPNWVKPNDPFFAMYPNNCVNRAVWLLRTVPTKTPTKEGKTISVLEYFLSMDEESFWMAIDRCPDCTSYPLFDAYYRHLHRKDSQLVNMLNQENDLDIDLLFNPSLELQSRVSGKRKLLRGRCIEGCPSEIRTRFKRTKFISLKNKIRTTFYEFN